MITVTELCKVYQTYNRREGVLGSVRDLISRNYQDLVAVDEITSEIKAGELIGFIGPNGAGKSSTIKMLSGILKPTSGEMDVFGFHPFRERKEYTRQIGVVFGQRTQLWWDIAVRESLNLLGKIYGVPENVYKSRLKNLEEILGLGNLLARPVRKLSLGERMRCDLAASLIHNPKVLFLDEPTIGLDQVAKDAIRNFLRKINKDFKTTIILTTHDLKEIEELCQRIVVLDKGKIIYDGKLSAVKNLPGLTRNVSIDFTKEAPIENLIQEFGARVNFLREGERRVTASVDPQLIAPAELVRAILAKHDVADLSITEPEIEQVISKIYRDGVTSV